MSGVHEATVEWRTGEGEPFLTRNYSRAHRWTFDGGAEVHASSSPSVVRVPLSDPTGVDPEEALVAALSSCHMLTFLALASNKGFVVDSYEDAAVGHLEKNASGKLAITRVELHPKIVYSGAKQPAAADLDWLHDKAHKECFIANSVTTEVKVITT